VAADDTSGAWAGIVRLVDVLAGDGSLVDEAVRDVQHSVAELGRLDRADIARHTRALLAAAIRAIADRRGPTEAELAFVEDLAVTRARQGVPIHDVLTAIHVAQRHVWSRARSLAGGAGVEAGLLMDARDLYDDWSEQVRARLIVAHRRTEIGQAQSQRDRDVQLVHRILEGGSAAALAAAEAGLPPTEPLWVVRTRPTDTIDAAGLEEQLRTDHADLFARVEEDLVGLLVRAPRPDGDPAVPVGVAGPLPVEEADVGAAWSQAALEGAATLGRTGLHEVGDVAVTAALRSRPDLARAVVDRRLGGLRTDTAFARDMAETVVAHVERDRNVEATAHALFVHPNTVRHRLKRFEELTGLRPDSSFDAIAAWWSLRQWLEEA
jgi:hypothetical protein